MNFVPSDLATASGAHQQDVEQTSTEPPLLVQYYRLALRRKWVIIGSIAAFLAVGVLVTLLMTRQYTATTTVEIARENKRIVQVDSVEQDTSTGDVEFYQTQYGLLRSQKLAERVASSLKLVDDPKFFAMFGVDLDKAGLGGSTAGRAFPNATRAARQRKAGEILLRNLGVSPVRLSRLVQISFTSPDPDLSARVANAWSQDFIQSNLERRFETTAYARKFLEGRLNQLRDRLEVSERQLVSYATQQRIINLPAQGATEGGRTTERSIVADDLATLNGELAKATAARVEAQARYAQTSGGRAGASTSALDNIAIGNLRQKRAEVAADLQGQLSKFEPSYPPVRALQTQLAQLDTSIAREERRVTDTYLTSYREAAQREDDLRNRVGTLKGDFLNLRRRSIEYNILQREVDTNRQLYDGLLQRYKEIGVAGGVGANNVSVIDPADVPERPSRPRFLLNLAMSLLLGLGVGILAALGLEQIDDAVSDPSDVERNLHIPLLGTIPSIDGNVTDTLLDRKSELIEAYLSLTTSLKFATPHGTPRALAVTSTRPAEGKSTTALAIATLLRSTGRRVLLIDGDMRSPSVAGLVNLDDRAGLSDFLSGNDDVKSLIKHAERFDLAVMTAGPHPPNAAELLAAGRLQALLSALREMYDHVVIDSPPVLGLADALLIASQVDGVVYAVESHGIKLNNVRAALARLRGAHINLFGAVVTKFDAGRLRTGHNYAYGYGYGDKDRVEA